MRGFHAKALHQLRHRFFGVNKAAISAVAVIHHFAGIEDIGAAAEDLRNMSVVVRIDVQQLRLA